MQHDVQSLIPRYVVENDRQRPLHAGVHHDVQATDLVNQAEEVAQVHIFQVHRNRFTGISVGCRRSRCRRLRHRCARTRHGNGLNYGRRSRGSVGRNRCCLRSRLSGCGCFLLRNWCCESRRRLRHRSRQCRRRRWYFSRRLHRSPRGSRCWNRRSDFLGCNQRRRLICWRGIHCSAGRSLGSKCNRDGVSRGINVIARGSPQIDHDSRNFRRELRQANFADRIQIACDLLGRSLQVRAGKIEHQPVGILKVRSMIGQLAGANHRHLRLTASLSEAHLLNRFQCRRRGRHCRSLHRCGLQRRRGSGWTRGA